jgi:hypothetical protein
VPADCRPVTPADLHAIRDSERPGFDGDGAGRPRWEALVDLTPIH